MQHKFHRKNAFLKQNTFFLHCPKQMHLLNHDTLIKAVYKHLVVQTCVYELKSAIWSNLFRIFRSFDDLMFESMQLLSSKCRLSTTKNNVTLQFQTENLHRLFYIPVFFRCYSSKWNMQHRFQVQKGEEKRDYSYGQHKS